VDVSKVPAPDMPSHWETSGSCHPADYRAAVLDLPPRMARCASKSFATPQSCFISIKVVAVGQQTGTNVDCINTEFVGFLALVGFAGEKNAEGASGPRRGLTSQSSALLVR